MKKKKKKKFKKKKKKKKFVVYIARDMRIRKNQYRNIFVNRVAKKFINSLCENENHICRMK